MIEFKQEDLFHFNMRQIASDIECVDIDKLISRIEEFMKEEVWERLIEFDMTGFEYTFKPATSEVCELICTYRMDGMCTMDIYLSPMALVIGGRKMDTDEYPIIRQRAKELFERLTTEFVGYYEEHHDPDSDPIPDSKEERIKYAENVEKNRGIIWHE